MENRVFERLSAWTALDDEALKTAIRETGARVRDEDQLKRARTLFANALESPGGLQIQTIHAFCTSVLQRFPLEANIAGHFDLLDDEAGRLLREEAIRQVIIEAAEGSDPALSDAFDLAYATSGESAITELFAAVFSGSGRAALSDFLDDRAKGLLGDHALYRAARLEPGATRADIAAAAWPLKSMPLAQMQELIRVAPGAGGASMPKFGAGIEAAISEADPSKRLSALGSIFLTEKGAPKSAKNLAKPAFVTVAPDFETAFHGACEEIRAALDAINRLEMVEVSLAAHRCWTPHGALPPAKARPRHAGL